MVITVDRYVTFGKRKESKQSIQFEQKQIMTYEPAQPIKNDECIRYLGRHVDFSMSNSKHKVELVAILESSIP